MTFVLDTSVPLSWTLADEQHPVALHVEQLLKTGAETALVPDIWWYEIRNILLISERRGRISSEGTEHSLRSLLKLRIEEVTERNEQALLDLARQHQLTVYDAAYLELAQREHLPLATLDKALHAAALSAGILLLA